ncbi:MAG: hypothetical protein KF819_22585 [Labilithrix sp.]|nr:hypothetical protein [Labilithrix sp.]
MPDELTKALLLEEVVDERAIAEALFSSVTGGVALAQVLAEQRAIAPEILGRYLARTDAPFLRQVVPVPEIVERLPAGLCARLLALPVRRDAITGTVDVVVADASDAHPAKEIGFHLGAPVRLVRAPLAAIVEALRKLRAGSLPPSRPPPASRPPVSHTPQPRRAVVAAVAAVADDERMYDSRPRAAPPLTAGRHGTLPPPEPPSSMRPSTQAHLVLDGLSEGALRPSRVPGSERHAHVVPAPRPQVAGDTAPLERARQGRETPPWGTPLHHTHNHQAPSDVPKSGLGSEIPIPLTRRTFSAVSGGTQRPPPLVDPREAALGEGYPVDPDHLRQIVEVQTDRFMKPEQGFRPSPEAPPAWVVARAAAAPAPMPSFIPGPPPVPNAGPYAAYAPQIPLSDPSGIIGALKSAGSRDEVLELVLTGARMLAYKVALFVVKRGGYLGWACTPEFGDRAALQTILVPLDAESVFEEAVREGLYLGPLRHDEVHGGILHVMRGASRDVAVVPIRVSGKTAVIIVADELGDTMLGTRRLEELARAAGDAFARIVRMRR